MHNEIRELLEEKLTSESAFVVSQLQERMIKGRTADEVIQEMIDDAKMISFDVLHRSQIASIIHRLPMESQETAEKVIGLQPIHLQEAVRRYLQEVLDIK